MLPIEAEYVVALSKLKLQTSADPKMDINEVKRSYQRLRDVFGNSYCGCLDVYCIFIIWLMCLDAKHGRELVAPHWRSWRVIKTMFYVILRKKNGTTEPATTARDIKLGPRHSTINGCPFLREYDATTSPYLLFMSDQAIEAMRACEQWNFDGTFQSAPKIFKQIFTVCGRLQQFCNNYKFSLNKF